MSYFEDVKKQKAERKAEQQKRAQMQRQQELLAEREKRRQSIAAYKAEAEAFGISFSDYMEYLTLLEVRDIREKVKNTDDNIDWIYRKYILGMG